MKCPKDRKAQLQDHTIATDLSVHRCPDCEGLWVSSPDYEDWQSRQPELNTNIGVPEMLDLDFSPSEFDAKAALCPECGHYLARARIGIKHPFYIERCPGCSGIWCDQGEWTVLEQLGLHTRIERLFSSEWQAKVREKSQADQERQSMIDKLGTELANQVFAIAESLENHPNGDFGVAYLMRRFDR